MSALAAKSVNLPRLARTSRWGSAGYRRFLVPALVIIAGLTVLPILFTIGLSTTSLAFTSLVPTRFVGIDNYVKLFSDPRFIQSLWQSAALIFIPVALQMIFGFLLALVMNERLPGLGWLQVIFVVPMFFPPVVMGLMWKVLFTPQLGGINYYVQLLGIQMPAWLSDPTLAMTAIIVAAVWGWTPFAAVMFYTAMQTFPKDLYEAARIDGAGWLQCVRFVTLPLLKSTALVVLIFRIMEALAIFPIIFVMTSGGPAGATETVNYYSYIAGFTFLKVGYASAMILSFLAILVIVLAPATNFLLHSTSPDRRTR
ncbi:MAG: sugar ABC transporter permease [Casimicrobiaceae bacterium]